jgi:hypothetical protein
MSDNFEEIQAGETPKRLLPLMSLLSLIPGGAALWYAWLRSGSLMNLPVVHWYQWVQPALFGLMGILCLLAAILFLLGRSSGWSVFKFGLSIVPLVLFSNLIVLLFRVIQNMLQGNPTFIFDRLVAQPQKILFVLIVLIALGWLGSLNERAKSSK